jgi:hypothetical protein
MQRAKCKVQGLELGQIRGDSVSRRVGRFSTDHNCYMVCAMDDCGMVWAGGEPVRRSVTVLGGAEAIEPSDFGSGMPVVSTASVHEYRQPPLTFTYFLVKRGNGGT